MAHTGLVVDERDEAGVLTATYVESSTDDTGKNSRIDTIVGVQRRLPRQNKPNA